MNVAQETLGFRRAGLSPALSLLMSAFALPIPPAALSSRLHRPTERSPTTHAIHSVRSLHVTQGNFRPVSSARNQFPHRRLDFESCFGLGRGLRRLTSRRTREVSLVQAWWHAAERTQWIARIPSFGYWLTAPLHLPRRTTRPVSYYAFFKGWLLLSQPPGCLSLPTSFAT